MKISYPHTIENFAGEKLIFHGVEKDPDSDKVIVENFVTPGHGPLMHTHYLQDEQLTVVKGKMGYQILGQEEQYAGEGETILFKRGVPHRFWNAGQEILNCRGFVKPANTIVFYLSAIYAAQNKSHSLKPEKFDGAYLLTRYAQEYDIHEMPPFVRKTIIPITYRIGQLLGKYKHFKDAPEPVKA
ncbi:cupin domain-containing protein [Adhaeribacter radiodurans]|uniref:Cupin domain-containing protein n=1 Tax=Adhaeribacter radiodurans TaxID=2745197 RepID=A0A7L7L4N6_9BACT|nr:cupin domain-containing protein [Adhaeribacter radiodurans]QMU27767.1 cupin domain-containing protein [Adhaeribacter radiodurans]